MANEKLIQDIFEAYVYAYPAVIEELTRRAYLNPARDGKQGYKTNTYYHSTALADASFKNVVAPNIDTVYSQAFLDLSEGALVLEKPELDRYVSITFLDAYTNCEHYIGTGADGNQAQKYFITGPDFIGEVPSGHTQIALPTQKNWSIVRTIIYNRDDIAAVKKIQEKIKLHPFGAAKQETVYKNYQLELDYKPIAKITALTLEEFFGIFNELLKGNKDQYAPADKLEQWKAYGIGAGEVFTIKEEIKEIEQAVKERFLTATGKGLSENGKLNGWTYPDAAIGIYKTNYLLRANVARNGLGANPVTMCVYPSIYTDSKGNALDGNKNYKLHFEKGQLPPVNEFGFWSITLYDSKERYLVDNEINRYGFNDRDVLQENEDGSIDIYIQKKKPEETKVSNWLPSPGEAFNLVLRIYLAKEEVFTNVWQPPVIWEIR